MARHWLHWVVGGGGGVSNKPSSAARRRSSTRISRDADADAPISPGCMCAVFQLFDLNHHHHHANHFLQDEAISSKGVEAPRNSLELEEPPPIKQVEENLTLPVGIQIKTRISNEGSKSRTEDIPGIDSPSAKTPNLVARLMGLDLLPDQCTSPSNSSTPQRKHMMRRNVILLQTIRSSSNNKRCFSFSDDDITVGTRSLPETPRISSARRSDSDYHIRSRHSLQNSNKENTCHQIVKQAKESTVGRRIGLNDITNSRSQETIVRRDQNLVLLKPTKKSSRPSEIITKLGFSDTKKNEQRATRTASSGDHSDYQRRVILNSMKPKKHQSVIQEHRRVPQQQNCGKKVNMMMETKKKKKKKKAPPLLSNEILDISGPILLPVKKDPSPPATKLPQKQMQSQVSDALSSKRNTQTLSSNTSRSYAHLHLQPINKLSTVLPDKHNGCATAVSAAAAAAAEYNTYVQKILKRTGINDSITPLALGKWHTPSHPLDPSIYYYLELFHPSTASSSAAASGVLSRRCNRKLIFQLVDELLAEILRPHLDFKPWVVSPPLPLINNGGDRPGLVDEICKRIGSFPAANCVVLEDIDSLVDGDLCSKWGLKGFFEDGGERLVREIEGEIVEELVRDTVAAMVGVRTAEEWNRDRSG